MTGEPPDPTGVSSQTELAARLRALRIWAGRPSLKRLRALGGGRLAAYGDHELDSLPESTTSYVLRGDRPASADFVRSFVAACLRVRQRDPAEIGELVDRWHQAWVAVANGAGQADDGRAVAGPPPDASVPRQLPADVAGFAGRGEELAALNGVLSGSGRAATTVVIAGPAGVGKTTLAVHAGHRLARRYPDGQLFIDLHGFAASLSRVEAGEALDRLLRALGVLAERIPADLDDRAALWRSVLAGRRMLIVLDNAAEVRQVEPLLPGATGCLVLVTSRRTLAGLAATGTVPLDVLPVADAVALFRGTVGYSRRFDGQPELLADAVELCGRLPLAVRIAAARLRSHPSWGLPDLVNRLQDQDRRLAELADDGGSGSIAAALEMSYRQLSAQQQLSFGALGLHPGLDLEPYAAAAMLGTTLEQAGKLLDRLLDIHLLQEPAPGRYVFHDLVRAYAAGTATAGTRWRRRQRRRAVIRLLDFYRHTASVAAAAGPSSPPTRLGRVPPARTPVPDLPTAEVGAAWCDAELPNLLAAARYAADTGLVAYTWHLSAALARHLRLRSRHGDAESLHRLALECASTAGHRAGELVALVGLGWARTGLSRPREAFEDFERALEIALATGDCRGELDALVGVGRIHLQEGRHALATDSYRNALAIAVATGERAGEGDALRGLGYLNLVKGRYEQAMADYTGALEIARATGSRSGELNVLAPLGEVHRLLGRYDQAQNAYRRCLEIARAIGKPDSEMSAMVGLSHIDRLRGRYEKAKAECRRALEIARSLGDRTAELSVLASLGWIHRRQGLFDHAAGIYQQILDIAVELGYRNWQFEAGHGLGRVHHDSGDHQRAVARHREAVDLATELDQPADRARAHEGLARAHRALGEHREARLHWQRALEILTDLGTDHTEDEEASIAAIRAQLAELGSG